MATYESRRYNTPVTDVTKIADGSVSNTEFEHLDGVTSDIQTQFTGKLPLAGGVMTGSVTSNDNVRARFGDSNDLQIYHNGSNSIIDNAVGALIVNADTLQLKNGANNATLATFTQGGNNNLRFNGSTKLETTNTGVAVTGAMSATTLSATTLTGNGSGLTNLNGSNISSGTVADARISTLTSSKLTGALPAIDGSNLTGIAIIPSSTSAVGSIMPFMIKRSNGSTNTGSLTLSAGTEVTPSTYSSGNLIIADYDNSLSKVAISSPSYQMGNTKGTMGQGNSGPVQGSSTSKTGVWRVIDPLFAGSATGGQGAGSFDYHFSIMGLMQRIS